MRRETYFLSVILVLSAFSLQFWPVLKADTVQPKLDVGKLGREMQQNGRYVGDGCLRARKNGVYTILLRYLSVMCSVLAAEGGT